jgi:uracil-DNA glycosylase
MRGDDIAHLIWLLDFPYPEDIQPVLADLPGPAFFPGGSGVLSRGRAARTLPRGGVMVLGHNFSTVKYYEGLRATGRENLNKDTWGKLLPFLAECGISVEECFFTNALMGLMRTKSNVGSVSGHEEVDFRKHCRRVFRATLCRQRPRLLLVLGKPAIRFVAEAFPDHLDFWRRIQRRPYRLLDIDDPDGPVRHDVPLPDGSRSLSVVALVHPSYRHRNASTRQFQGQKGMDSERAMVAHALGHTV